MYGVGNRGVGVGLLQHRANLTSVIDFRFGCKVNASVEV